MISIYLQWLFFALVFAGPSVQDSPYSFTTIFGHPSDTTAACYRIPALAVATNGTLLAVADQRIPDCGDLRNNPDINLVLRKSYDDGNSWSDMEVLVDLPSGKSASDAAFIVDETSRDVLLLYNMMDLEKQPQEYRFHYIRSSDQGHSWQHLTTVFPGSAAYVSMVALPDQQLGLLFEKDDYDRIVFTRVPTKK
jgi:sialidase-1